MVISVAGCAVSTSQSWGQRAESTEPAGWRRRCGATAARQRHHLAALVLALLAVACGHGGGAPHTPVAPTPLFPEVRGQWEGALHDTRRSGPPEWDVAPCDSLASCAAHEMVEADFVQDGGTVTGTVTFAEGAAAPFTFAIQSGTISTAGTLRLTFDDVEVPGPVPGIRIRLALEWEGQVEGSSMTGTVTARSTSTNADSLPGTAVFEGCLGPGFAGSVLRMAAMMPEAEAAKKRSCRQQRRPGPCHPVPGALLSPRHTVSVPTMGARSCVVTTTGRMAPPSLRIGLAMISVRTLRLSGIASITWQCCPPPRGTLMSC